MKEKKYILCFLLFLLVCAVTGIMYYEFGPNQIHTKEVSLSGYKGIKIKNKIKTDVSDADIKKAALEELESQELFQKVKNRKIQKGDIVRINVKGYFQGTLQKSMSIEDFDLEIGSNTFIDGFESGLIGKKPGEKIVLSLCLPDNYSNKVYAGKDVIFHVDVQYIKELYNENTLTDEVVKKYTRYETVDKFYEKTKEKLQKQAEEKFLAQGKKDLWKNILKKADIKEYSEKYWEEEIDSFDQWYEMQARSMNLSKEDFIKKYYGYDMEEYARLREETCEENVARKMIVKAIAKKEGIEASSYKKLEKEVEDFLMEYAEFIN